MAAELRLAANALALRRFTAAELATSADVNPHTTRSWLLRHRASFVLSDEEAQGRGRPKKIYTLLESALSKLRREVEGVARLVTDNAAESRQRALVDAVEEKLRTWKIVGPGGSPFEVEQHFAALRVAVSLAWQQLADIEGIGAPVGMGRLRHLAELESEAGIAVTPSDVDLRELATWLAARLARIVAREVPDEFAAKVLWLRSEVRSRPERVRAISAALAAPVWSDEGLASDDVSEEALLACRRIAEVAPMAERLDVVSYAIGSNAGPSLRIDDEQAQAITRGLTSCRDAFRSHELHDWLAGAPVRSGWRASLAPVAVHLLLEAPNFILPRVMHQMRAALKEALEANWAAGHLRAEAIEKSKGALGYADDVERFRRSKEELSDEFVAHMAGTLALKPDAEPFNV